MASMRPYERAASIREQLDRILGNSMNPLAPQASSGPPANASTPKPAPTEKKKKPRTRSTALTDAKNVLRAAQAATSKSLAAPSARRSPTGRAPQFIHRTPEIARHRRKCAVCHHPEREAIEDLFIHWHSPSSIASYYDDGDEESNERAITWVSIYRHAYAFGLDEIRRRNLRFAFEHILDQAGTTAATPASIIVAARALGSCVNENGAWNEPPKRVLVTNIIRNESPQTAPPAQIENHANSEHNVACVGADRNHRPAPPEAKDNRPFGGETGGESATASPALGGRSFSSDNENDDKFSPARALHPRDVVDPIPASLPPGFRASEIRNSSNSFNFNEPPISNR